MWGWKGVGSGLLGGPLLGWEVVGVDGRRVGVVRVGGRGGEERWQVRVESSGVRSKLGGSECGRGQGS